MMNQITSKNRLNFLLAVFFSGAVLSVPWGELFLSVYGYEYIDRSNYYYYFLFGQNVLEYKVLDSLLHYVSNEFLWHYFIDFLVHSLGIQINYVFGFISFFTIFIFARIVSLTSCTPAMLLLVNPLVIDLAFSQLRIALAIALLGSAYLLKNRTPLIPVSFVAISPFVHTAAVIFITIYYAPLLLVWLRKRYGHGKLLQFGALILIGTFISLLIGPLREAVLSYFADRRAEYHDMSSSVLYSMFWISLLVPLAVFYRKILSHDFAQYTVIILSIVTVNVLHGGYSTRFLAASFPFIISSMFLFSHKIKFLVVLAFVFYALIQWLYWFRFFGGV